MVEYYGMGRPAMRIPDDLCVLRDAGDHEQATSAKYGQNGWTPRSYMVSDTLVFQYTWSGKGIFEFGERTKRRRDLPPATAFMTVYPGAFRYWYPGGREPWEFSWVSVTLGDQTERVRNLIDDVGPVHPIPPDSMLIDCLKICSRHSIPHVLNPYQRSILGYRFVMELMDHFATDNEPLRMPPALAQCLQFIEENLDRRLSLGDICRSAGLSATSINIMFRKHVGISVFRYLNQRRLEKAKRILTASDQAVKAVASMVGFSTDNYFCKVFRKHVGVSPAAYRAEERMDGATAPPVQDEA